MIANNFRPLSWVSLRQFPFSGGLQRFSACYQARYNELWLALLQQAQGKWQTLPLHISKLFQCQRFTAKGKRCADGSNNSHFQGRLPSLLCRQISSEPPAEASQGDGALFPHGRQEEDAVRRLMPPGSDGRTDCWRGTHWNPSLIEGSCDSRIFQKRSTDFTKGSLEELESLPRFHQLLIKHEHLFFENQSAICLFWVSEGRQELAARFAKICCCWCYFRMEYNKLLLMGSFCKEVKRKTKPKTRALGCFTTEGKYKFDDTTFEDIHRHDQLF